MKNRTAVSDKPHFWMGGRLGNVIWILALALTMLAFTCGNAVAGKPLEERSMWLHVQNVDSKPVTITLIGGNCYEGTPGNGQIWQNLAPGRSVDIFLARVQGHGCDGKQGYFKLKFDPPVGANEIQAFEFDNDRNLTVVATQVNRYPGHLQPKARDGSYTYTTYAGFKINPTDGAQMIWIPCGPFLMGQEKKTVRVEGFWMYKTEVTVAQYRKFCEATKRAMPQAPPWGWRDEHPMVNVSWDDAKSYCAWAGVSLPTDEQWEKAARGTDGRIYPWGDGFDASKAVCRTNQPTNVGSKPAGASPYGCLDMAGNVWEWCENEYSHGDHGDGRRVLRGGSWDGDPDDLRSSNRVGNSPNLIYNYNGFRCSQGG